MDPSLEPSSAVQPPSPHTSIHTSLPTDPLQDGDAGGSATDIAHQLTAHAHLGEGVVATLGLAYTELVAV
jgi:hypothetical protein